MNHMQTKTLEELSQELESSIKNIEQAKKEYLEALFTSAQFLRYGSLPEKEKITKYINDLK